MNLFYLYATRKMFFYWNTNYIILIIISHDDRLASNCMRSSGAGRHSNCTRLGLGGTRTALVWGSGGTRNHSQSAANHRTIENLQPRWIPQLKILDYCRMWDNNYSKVDIKFIRREHLI